MLSISAPINSASANSNGQSLIAVQPNLAPVSLSTSTSHALIIAQSRRDIIDTASAHGSFQTFLRLLNQLGMAEDLKGYGRFTVFAPTDAAFSAMPASVMQALSNNRDLMAKVLAYHVISSRTPLYSQDLNTPLSLQTLERSDLQLTRRDGALYINDARVTEANIVASNGVIHALDRVLIPEDVLAAIR
jgi:uncharacterized surface protein with fasciclin (FAS1) repeats